MQQQLLSITCEDNSGSSSESSAKPRKHGPKGPRGKVTHVWFHPVCGQIAYYEKSRHFIATCTAPGHTNCTLSRTAKAPKPDQLGRRPGQGRPVPRLAAWLDAAAKYSNKRRRKKHIPSLPDRRKKRDSFKTPSDETRKMLSYERDLRDGESDTEPEVVM